MRDEGHNVGLVIFSPLRAVLQEQSHVQEGAGASAKGLMSGGCLGLHV